MRFGRDPSETSKESPVPNEMDSPSNWSREGAPGIKDRARETAAQAAESASRGAEHLSNRMSEAMEDLGARSDEWMAEGGEIVDRAREYVRAHPLAAVAAAAAAGFLISRLMR